MSECTSSEGHDYRWVQDIHLFGFLSQYGYRCANCKHEIKAMDAPAMLNENATLKRELQDAKELIYRYENPDDVLAEEASHE